jgi:hypothetical protein
MSLTKVTHPMMSYVASSTPTFTEASGVLYRDTGFDNQGNVTTIPASKQYNYIGIRNGGSANEFAIGSGGSVAGLTYYMKSNSSSNAASNMYAVIGSLYNEGPGTTKALYGRAQASSGCTGVVMGAVLRTQIDTGATPSAAWCLQIGPAGDLAKIAGAVIQIDHEQGTVGTPGKAEYGILQNINIGFTQAMIRGVAGGGGDFLRWQAVTGGSALFSVNDAGDAETVTKFKVSTTELSSETLQRTAVGGNFGIHLNTTGILYFGGINPATAPITVSGTIVNVVGNVGARLNFTNLSSASAGALVGYFTVNVDGTDRKIPYYAVS